MNNRRELLVVLVLMVLALGAGQWLRSSRPAGSDEQGAQLRALVKRPAQLQMISSTTCAYCVKARLWLSEQKVPFDECFVETDAQCRQRWLATGAQATPTFVVGRTAVLGLDPPKLIELLAQPQ